MTIDVPHAPIERFALTDGEMEALREMVSARVGYEVIFKRREEITQNNDPNHSRRYQTYVFSSPRPPRPEVKVFVKTGMSLHLWKPMEPLHRFLTEQRDPDFSVPAYFGYLNSGDEDPARTFGVWEHIDMAPPRDRVPVWLASGKEIALAAAAMTALTDEVRQEAPLLRPAAGFMGPLAGAIDDAIAQLSRKGADVSSLRGRVAELASLEAPALERLASLGGYFTHNDFRSANVSIKARERPVVFDWDGASYGPPGATLRTFTRRPAKARQAVDVYCSSLESKGFSFRRRDVLFAARAMEVFHGLAFGCRISRRDKKWREHLLRWSLEHTDYLRV